MIPSFLPGHKCELVHQHHACCGHSSVLGASFTQSSMPIGPCFNSMFSNSSLCILVSGCKCNCEHLFASPRSSDLSNCADLLPAAAIIAKLGERFSLPAALNPVNGEMPASLNDATSERVMIWQALIAPEKAFCIPFFRIPKQLRSNE